MARKFLTNIDLNTNELQNAVVQNLSSAPNSGNKEGRIYFDSVTKKLRYFGNDAWHDLAAGGAAASTVTLTGPVTGTANVDPDTGIISITTTIENDSVALGTQTTGDYVAGISGTGYQIDVSNSGGEGSTPTLSLPATIKVNGLQIGDIDSYIKFDSGSGDIGLNPDSGTTRAHGSFIASYDLRVGAQDNANGYFYVQQADSTIVFKVDSANALTSVNGILEASNGSTKYIQIFADGANNDARITAWNNDLILDADGVIKAVQLVKAQNGINTSTVSSDDVLTLQSGTSSVDITGNTAVNITAPTTTVTGNAHVTGDLQVDGDVNITGKLNAINREEINIQDNTIRLNTGFTGSPTADAGIIVERGTANDTAIIWSESNDNWTLTNDGSNYFAIARKYVTAIGDESNTSFDVVHNLGTRDVTVQVYQNSSSYDVVETDIQMKDGNTVTVSFTTAPALNAYKVVIIG